MDLKVHCPGCRAVLMVPVGAAGRVARCPACETRFQIPSQEDIAEQTVSAWLEHDLEELEETIDEQWKRRLREEAERKVRESIDERDQTAEQIEKVWTGTGSDQSGPGPAPDGDRKPAAADPVKPPGAAPVAKAPASPPGKSAAGTIGTMKAGPLPMPVGGAARHWTPANPGAAATPASPTAPAPSRTPPAAAPTARPGPGPTAAPAGPPPAPPVPPSAPAAAGPVVPAPPADPVTGEYPTELIPAKPTPHLVVVHVAQTGVRLAFDSRFLRHEGFRLSMPMACAFSNERRVGELIARPLAFTDRSQAVIRSAQEIEAGHEQRLNERIARREMLKIMGMLPSLAEPFNWPMPYYVSTSNSIHSLHCSTRKRESDGGITCEVLIPDGRVALEWLRNVNGICGIEHDLLARDVDKLWLQEWLGIEERVRQRLSTWVDFEPGERFRFYINDADLPKKDEGLAGIVLTDRRVIYHKYHRHGQVVFGQDASLFVRPDGRFAGLTVKTEDGSVKAAKFHFDDLEKLRDAARELNLKIDVARA